MQIKPELKTKGEGFDWETWLSEYDSNLTSRGYVKYRQNLKREDFCYWKEFKKDGKSIFMVGVLFYDFRRYNYLGLEMERIGTMYTISFIGSGRADLDISNDMDLPEIEKIARIFYELIYPLVEHASKTESQSENPS
jgi:hypothetical protein